MSIFPELFGASLRTHDGNTVSTESALADKQAVALYMSAHWCPPCRSFTPALADAYKQHLKAKGLEIVFVSADRSEEDFNGYHAEMPWLAIPYDDRERRNKLSRKFNKSGGIPSLVVLDAKSGEVITDAGRRAVMTDPEGKEFPWRPKSVSELLGDTFIDAAEGPSSTVGRDRLEGKLVGLYFSAHWCPPCRGFTPELAKCYKAWGAEKNWEIVFISSDRDESNYNEYLQEMPWLALPFDKRAAKQELSERFGVRGIPTLVLLDTDGSVITTDARSAVDRDPQGEEFPWRPKPFNDISETLDGLNECPSVMVLADKEEVDATAKKAAVESVRQVAQEHYEAAGSKVDDMEIRFFSVLGGGPVAQVRGLTKITETAKPVLFLLDIQDGAIYHHERSEDAPLTAKDVRDFVQGYKDKSLTRTQLGN